MLTTLNLQKWPESGGVKWAHRVRGVEMVVDEATQQRRYTLHNYSDCHGGSSVPKSREDAEREGRAIRPGGGEDAGLGL